MSFGLAVTKADKNHPAGMANDGYWGIHVKPKNNYHASIHARAGTGFSGSFTLSIVINDGKKVYASALHA